MNDYELHVPKSDDSSLKNKFPISIQLVILSAVMIGMFSTVIFNAPEKTDVLLLPEQEISVDNKRYPVTPQRIDKVSLKAEAAYVWDVKGQRALYSQNAEKTMPLASITKLMTALLAYELISSKETATVSLSAVKQEGSSGLSVGEEFKIEELNELALISSSNDAAYVLAASAGNLLGINDPANQFIQGMNIRATELGLNSLKFNNATGLDVSESVSGGVGSAKDVSFLMEHIITNYPEIIAPTQKSATRIYNVDGAYHDANNTNKIALDIPNLIGSKTGYTDLAGGNLTVAFDAGFNRPMIITVLGSTREDRFTDVLTLINEVEKSLSN
jgi:D-alanyl-D-alanine carboxypeptidase (penicillin-binding protein 5/6)